MRGLSSVAKYVWHMRKVYCKIPFHFGALWYGLVSCFRVQVLLCLLLMWFSWCNASLSYKCRWLKGITLLPCICESKWTIDKMWFGFKEIVLHLGHVQFDVEWTLYAQCPTCLLEKKLTRWLLLSRADISLHWTFDLLLYIQILIAVGTNSVYPLSRMN